MIDYSVASLVKMAKEKNTKISDVVIEIEIELEGVSRETLIQQMKQNLDVMQKAVERGLKENLKSTSGMSGGEGRMLEKARLNGKLNSGDTIMKAVARAMAVANVNAAMGKIVAAPTAGSCGIIPGALLSAAEHIKASQDEILMALFTAGGIGRVITEKATVSGAEGGCQAECGSAAAMAAGAIVEMAGGSPDQVSNAVAFALKNVLGLVCDPVGGLVEVPCIKRNAMGAANALISSDMALAGLQSFIPADEVIGAMYEIGKKMPVEFKETALGGLAATPTAKRFYKV
ncbi:MAG: L-serine dehydratase [Thermosediminibacterales bacterium]|nr:L-serine dehydratase [Thermosediminibacterales bacterium]